MNLLYWKTVFKVLSQKSINIKARSMLNSVNKKNNCKWEYKSLTEDNFQEINCIRTETKNGITNFSVFKLLLPIRS